MLDHVLRNNGCSQPAYTFSDYPFPGRHSLKHVFVCRQLGDNGPAAYLPQRVVVESLLRGGDQPGEIALRLCPRPAMLVTPVGGEGKEAADNSAAFQDFLRHLTESEQLALVRDWCDVYFLCASSCARRGSWGGSWVAGLWQLGSWVAG
jgi:hypothetical protein